MTNRNLWIATLLMLVVAVPLGWGWSDEVYLDEAIPIGLEENFDRKREVGPGVSESQTYSHREPLHISWVTISRDEDVYQWRAMKAEDRVEGNERLSLLAPRSEFDGWQALAGINGDFWAAGGRPVGLGVFDGHLLTLGNGRPAVAQTTDGELHMDRFHFKVEIEAGDTVLEVDDINFPANRMENPSGVIIYTPQSRHPEFPAWPPARLDGETPWAAVGFRDANGNVLNINEDLEGELFAVDADAIAMDWPDDLLVIVGYGDSAASVEALAAADDAEIDVECAEFTLPAEWALGGGPILLSDGEVVVTRDGQPGFSSGFITTYHPRSLIGWNDDEVILMVIDGRQPRLSRGMDLVECAEWMQSQGMTYAMNFDGGGSSSLWVRGSTASRPSDAGGERSVTDALILLTSADLPDLHVELPAGTFDPGEIAEWTMFPTDLHIAVGDSVVLHPRAWASDGERVRVPRDAVRLDVFPDGIGAITRDEHDQITLTGEGGGEAALNILARGDDEPLASFPLLVGHYETIVVDGFEDGDVPELRLLNCVEDATSVAWTDSPVFDGQRALTVTYDMPHSGGLSVAYVDLDVALPDGARRVGLQVYGDGEQAWLRGIIKDADGEQFIVDFTNGAEGVDWEDSWRWVSADLTSLQPHWDNPDAHANGPYTFETIYLAQSRTELKGAGTVVLDSVGASVFTSEAESPESN